VPFALLDEVIQYLSEPPKVFPADLSPDKLYRFEAVSSVVLKLVDDPRTVDRFAVAVSAPGADASEVRELWGYIQNVADADVDPQPDPHLDSLLRRALDLPKEEWDLVHLARDLNLGIWEAKRLETSLKIFQGGAYRVTTKPTVAKAAPRTPPVPPPRVATPKKVEEAREVKRCGPHQAKALSHHACGAWLCSACLDEAQCPQCRKPLHRPKPPTDEEDLEEPEAPLPPPPPKDEERPPARRREEDRDFSRL